MPCATVRVAAVLFAIASVTAIRSETPAAARGPAIRFDETTHDFGTVRSDKKQTLSWAYHNIGTAPLEIRGTAPSCGCTVSKAQEDAVPPGGRGALEIVYDPAGQSGGVHKTIAVMTNDPVHPRTMLNITAQVVPVDEEPAIPGHPRFTGQSLLMGSCATCHSAPAAGKSGEPLYAALCAMCHGLKAEGGRAPSLRVKDYLASHDDKTLGEAIAYGTANPKMPGFSDLMGGPLDAAQVASLVKLLRTWGPSSTAASPPKR